jgi:hypothetical protein
MLASLAAWAGTMLGAQAAAAQAPGSQLRPGHIVRGTVKDAGGNPVAMVLVTAVRKDERAAVNRGPDAAERPYGIVQANLGAMTDSSGRYELSLPYAGEFYLVALPRQATRAVQRSGYGNTFHPNAARFADAVPVPVRPGPALTADITLVPARLAVVSGTVFDSTGTPAKGGRLLISPGDGLFGVGGQALSLRPDGRFVLPNVQPGTYFLQFRESAWPPPRGTVPVLSNAKVVVNGEDVDLRVLPIKPARATGRLVIDGGADQRLEGARVGALPVPIDGNPGPSYPGTVRPDGTFEFRAWQLPSRIRVFVQDREYAVKAVRLNGRDLPHGIVDFEKLGEIAGLEVVVR